MNRLKCFFSLILSLWTVCAGAKTSPVQTNMAAASPRVAVLCEQQDTELLGLSEQVEVLLAQRNDLAMLDRANMDQLLREQGLQATQGQDMETIVRIGKLLRTDLLVVAGKYEGFFAWRFVDVKNGVLAGLHVTRWPAEQRSVAASEAEKAIVATTRQIGDGAVEGKHYLSIVRFVNQDLSRQHDSLEEVLPVLLSAQLSTQSGIGLVERSRLSKVSEEKTGTEGVDGEYKAGTLIVKGEISILRTNATPSASVLLLAGKPNQAPTIRLTCTGPLGDLPSLARTMAEGLLNAMDVKLKEGAPFDAHSEADTFYLKGNFFMAQKDYRSAVSLFETACALNPDETNYRSAFVNGRRNLLKAKLPQEIKLVYYIQEASDWEQQVKNGQKKIDHIKYLFDEPWYDTTCLLKVQKDSPLASLQDRAAEGFKACLRLSIEICEKQKELPSIRLEIGMSSALFDSTVFEDPQEFCRYLRRLVDLEHLLKTEGGLKEGDTFSLEFLLSKFASEHLLPSAQAPTPVVDAYMRTAFDSLTNDQHPQLRIRAYIALIVRDHKKNADFIADGRSNVVQSIAQQLAVWTLPYLPGEYSPVGFPFYRKLESYINGSPMDVIRSALKEPGATYTSALDGVVQQFLLKYHRAGYPDVPLPYHAWTDILCLHLDHLLQKGQKDSVLQRAQKVFSTELENKDVQQATYCMNQVKAVLDKYAVDYSSITNVPKPVVVAKIAPPKVIGHPVAWHLKDSDIHSDSIYVERTQLTVENGTLEYVINRWLDGVKLIKSTAYSFDIATGRLLSKRVSKKNLFRSDPELGLPPQEVKSWCKVKETYFVGCEGGFGKYEKGQFTQICNSRNLDQKYPLSGGTLYTVMGIRADSSGTKLYLAVKDGETRGGVWEHVLATGAQRQLIQLKDYPFTKFSKCEVKESCLFLSGDDWLLIFDAHAPDASCLLMHGGHKGRNNILKINDLRWTGVGTSLISGMAGTPELFVCTPYFEAHKTFVWERGMKEPRALVLVDSQGNEVSPINYKAKEICKWIAVPQGFIYQLDDGSIGLLTNWGPKGDSKEK